jgi:arylsulfatase A-like enzyme
LAVLDRPPFAERTAVMLTSDHGEAFGEHGLYRHGFEVWEELVHVPLLVRVPGISPRHVTARRSAIDVVPTVLELFGLPIPERTAKDFLSGVSLVPDLVLRSDAESEARPVLVDMSEGPNNAERQAFFEGPYKLIATNGKPIGLYDLERDPGETKDLLGDAPTADPVLARFKVFRRTLRIVPPKR